MKTFTKALIAVSIAVMAIPAGAHAAPLAPTTTLHADGNVRVTLASGSQHYGSRENQTRLRGAHPPRYYEGRRPVYHNGYRGYREARRGYRHYRGYWFPQSAFSFRIIVAPRAQHRPQAGHYSRHVSWCANRYRTYRVSDNTYIPRVGHRAYCRSPYPR